MRILVLLGAPGAGKGTQADHLAGLLGLPHIATGNLFRAAAAAGTPLGRQASAYMERGELVPDDVTVRMLLERLDETDAAAGAILDGFPRTAAQAAALDDALVERGAAVEKALLIDVPERDLVERLSGRRLCRAEGHPYHLEVAPPRVAGVCDVDGSALYQRDDDRSEVIRARLEKQLDALGEVVEHYRGRGVLVAVDGRRPIGDVSADLLAVIDLGQAS